MSPEITAPLFVVRRNISLSVRLACVKGGRPEWRCPSEFSVLANVKSDDRAALKNAIRRVHKFLSFFSACRHDVHGVTQLFVRILQA